MRRKSDLKINSPVLSTDTEFSIGFIVLDASVKSNLEVKRMSETRLGVKALLEFVQWFSYFAKNPISHWSGSSEPDPSALITHLECLCRDVH